MSTHDELLDSLNSAQRAAVTHGDGPLLIVAGAGTGKTKVLTTRYVWLMREKQLAPEQILALTFTEKAAGEMEDRIISMLPNGTYNFWISTFHGFCQRVLEEKGLEIGLPHQFRLLNETDTWLLLKRRIDELPLDHYRPMGNPVKFLSALQSHLSRAKDENVHPEDYIDFALNAALDGDAAYLTSERKRLKELADLSFAYRKIMRESGALDFGDLILETLRLFTERPGVLRSFRERFSYVLVDEFQDTNWAQYELIKLLVGSEPRTQEHGVHRSSALPSNVTVVGDDDQAIYKFRGASLANILQFKDDYPQAQTVFLTDNYRSHQEILDVAYQSIRKNDPYRLEVKLASEGLTKELKAQKGNGGTVKAVWYPTIDAEAFGVAKRIAELHASDPSLSWNDFAILVRSNDTAQPFIQSLEALGIPYRFYALRGLYTKPIILDCTSILRSLLDPYDSTALWRILQMPVVDLGASDAAKITFYANAQKGIGLWQACHRIQAIPDISERGRTIISDLVKKIERLAEDAKRESPMKVFQLLLEQFGLLRYVLHLPEAQKIEQIEWLNGFAQRIKRYEMNAAGPTVRGFVEDLSLEIESGEEGALRSNPDEGPDLVKILTIHASKGLEFRHVFLVSMVDQRFPTRRRTDAIPLPEGLVKERLPEGDTHLEEERRLFYVAITRAKETLTMSGADDYGGTRRKKPSPFLTEIGIPVTQAAHSEETTLQEIQAPEISKTETEDRFTYPLKRRFSYTQLAAFRACPLQYKFAHLYRIPILGSFQKSFGQSIHRTLHGILKLHLDRGKMKQGDLFESSEIMPSVSEGFRVTKEEAIAIFETCWIDEWYPTRAKHEEYFQEGRTAVSRFWESCMSQPPNVRNLELPFDWRIGEHSLRGAIDRIDHHADGSIAILDYKTGESKISDDLTSEDKEQLRIYQIAMEEKGERVTRLALVYVRDMTVAEVELVSGEKREAFIRKLEERMKGILISSYDPTPSPFVCKYCDFKNMCEHRSL